jgi:hypothetical protein
MTDHLPYVYLAVCALIVLAALVWYASDKPAIESGEHRREETK